MAMMLVGPVCRSSAEDCLVIQRRFRENGVWKEWTDCGPGYHGPLASQVKEYAKNWRQSFAKGSYAPDNYEVRTIVRTTSIVEREVKL